jgi:hypothetical protein
MKQCHKCLKFKEEINFAKSKRTKDGLKHWCKQCNKNLYYEPRIKTLVTCKVCGIQWKTFQKTAEYCSEECRSELYYKEWAKNNPDKIKQKSLTAKKSGKHVASSIKYTQNKLKNNINFKLLTNIRSRIRHAINNNSGTKAYKSIELLGCSPQEARQYLESKFQDGMSWDNYGLYGWHIDHVIPCDAFDLTDPEQQKQCFHYTNLQPLWADDNLKKSNKVI